MTSWAGWRQIKGEPAHYVSNPRASMAAVCGADLVGGEPIKPAEALAGVRCDWCRFVLGEARTDPDPMPANGPAARLPAE